MMEREEPALISMKVIALVDARPKRELISSKLISCSTNQSNVTVRREFHIEIDFRNLLSAQSDGIERMTSSREMALRTTSSIESQPSSPWERNKTGLRKINWKIISRRNRLLVVGLEMSKVDED